MSEEILINFTPQETRVAVMHQGVVQELHIERSASRGFVGNIYVGRIVRILPGMQSAFIDIGLGRTAFLHVADIREPRPSDEPLRPIERLLFEGQSILVQVIKDPMGSKGARLSTQVSIAGRMLVYLPQDKHIGISQRIERESEREALREKLGRLVPGDEVGGFIVRTMAESASEAELAKDIEYLRKLWRDILTQSTTAAPPSLLYQELSLAQRVLRDFVNPETARIVIDSRENFQRLTNFAAEYTPTVAPLLEHYVGERPLFDLHGVEDELQKALARRVDLKSGGYLIIDQTEAMTTIDVNTGGFVGVRNFDDTIFKTNLEAAQTIARQLRLRNLGGIIIIDFIDMENEEHRTAVLSEFNKALARDHTRLTVNGFTALGLVEMTRKRTRESLGRLMNEPCFYCDGTGNLQSKQTVAYEILRQIKRERTTLRGYSVTVNAHPAIVDLMKNEERTAVQEAERRYQRRIDLVPRKEYHLEQFDLVGK